MNEENWTIIALCVCAWPFIGLLILIALNMSRKIWLSIEASRVETQPEGAVNGQYIASEPESTQQTLNLIAAAIIVALAGVLLGVATSLLSHIIHIVFLFPLGMGFLGGLAVEKTITKMKIRKIPVAVALGILMTIAMYGIYHFTNYQVFRFLLSYELNQTLMEKAGMSNPEVASVIADYAIKKESGYAGLAGYILIMAKEGISIGRIISTTDLNLGPFITWFYWMIELAMIAWVIVGVAKDASSKPFCEICKTWYGNEEHLGGCTISEYEEVLQAFKQKNFSKLGGMLVKDAGLPSLEIYTQTCRTCNRANPWFILRKVSFNRNGRLKFRTLLQQYGSASDRIKILEAPEYNATRTSVSSQT